MSELKPIERMARASLDTWRQHQVENRPELADVTFDDLDEGEREFAFLHARAMLLAIREPTSQMVAVAHGVDVDAFDATHPDSEGMFAEGGPEKVWRAMIDKALEEPK